MDKRNIVLNFIRQNGPSIPGQMNKILEMDILFTSAFISELVINGDLQVSKVKLGGSPLYYIKGQEGQLENYIGKLHEKERKAVGILKENLVLKDKNLEPVIRVALRNAKDFAKPVFVTINNQKELFWKWFLFKDPEGLKNKIHSILKIKQNKRPKEKKTLTISKDKKDAISAKEIKPKIKEKQESLSTPEKTKEGIIMKIENELKKKNIFMIDYETIRKEKEFDIWLKIPSAIGNLRYYCKYLDKKKINDKDLSGAFVKGQMEKLPVLILTGGDLTKKAETMLRNELHIISFKRIRI